MTAESAPERLYGAEFKRDPYPTYARLRQDGPVHPVEFPSGVVGWLVTGYEAAQAALADPRLGKDHSLGNDAWRALAAIMPEPQHSQLQAHLLHQDPPKHTVMRSPVAEALSPRRVAERRERIEQIAESLLDELAPAGTAGVGAAGTANVCPVGPAASTEVGAAEAGSAGTAEVGTDDLVGSADLVSSFAARFSFAVLSEMIGLPAELQRRFRREWCKVVQPVGPRSPLRGAYIGLLEELQLYIDDVIEDKRRNPAEDLLSTLVAANAAGELSDDELTSTVFQLLVAGQEPVTNQICMAVITLLTHPEQLDQLRSGAVSVPRAVEELFRFDGSFELTTWRFFREPTELHDVKIPAGDSVIVSLCAANRDPARFASPDTLDLTRTPNPHLAFGHGIHFCPGAALGRLEVQTAVSALLRRLPDLRLATSPDRLEWIQAVLTRGVSRLPVEFTSPSNGQQ